MSLASEATFFLPLAFEKPEVIGEAYIAGMPTARQFPDVNSSAHI